MSLSEPMVIHSAKMMSGYDMIHAHLTVKLIAKHAIQNIISIIPTHPTYVHYRILCCNLTHWGETSWIRISDIPVKLSEQPKSKSLRITTSILYYLNMNPPPMRYFCHKHTKYQSPQGAQCRITNVSQGVHSAQPHTAVEIMKFPIFRFLHEILSNTFVCISILPIITQ